MVRSELLQKLCNHHPNLLRKDIEKILEIIFLEIMEALCREENIEIRGFGTFKIVLRKARMGRNPKTGEEVPINPRRVLVFRPSHVLKEQINKSLSKPATIG